MGAPIRWLHRLLIITQIWSINVHCNGGVKSNMFQCLSQYTRQWQDKILTSITNSSMSYTHSSFCSLFYWLSLLVAIYIGTNDMGRKDSD